MISRWKNVVPCVLAMATSLTAWALDPSLRITQFGHDVWQQRDGLPSSVVQAIAQTPDGFLWLGTPTGLVRFDGIHFTEVSTYPADPNRKEYIWCLAVAPDGALWVGTRYDGLRRVSQGGAQLVAPPGLEPIIRDLAFDSDGQLHIATTNGLFRLVNDHAVERVPMRELLTSALACDRAGRMWVGFSQGLDVRERDGTTSTLMDDASWIGAVLPDRRGDVWVGTHDGLSVWRKGVRTPWKSSNGGSRQRISQLCEDRDNTLWIGAFEGVARIAADASPDVAPELLPTGDVLALCEDQEGSLWIGTDDGLHRLRNVNAVPWGAAEGLPSDRTPSVIAGPDGAVYVLSSSPTGVTRLKDGVLTRHETVIDGPNYLARDGALWVGTTGHLSRLKDGVVTQFGVEQGLLKNWISAIAEDEKGLLLAHSDLQGLRHWDGATLSRYRFRDGTEFTVPFHVTGMLHAPDDSVWAVGYDGLWHLDHGQVTRYTTPAGDAENREWYETHPQSPQWFRNVVEPALSDFWLMAIAQDRRGVLWLSSQRGGVTRLKDGKFTAFTTRQGLKTNQIYAVVPDDDGDLWMSTPGGIMHVRGSEMDAVADGRALTVNCELLTRADGLRNDECVNEYQPNATRAANGTLWFATKNGVVSIDPKRLQRNTRLPPVHLTQVLVDGVEQRLTKEPVFEPGAEKFEFHFTAPSLLVPERVRFRYQLVGYDRQWVDAGGARFTQYTRLAPGRYEFRVRACNNDGVWNETGATFAFTLQPHFRETAWFYALCALGLVAGGLGLHRWRVRELNHRKKLLKLSIEERTAELQRTNVDLQREIAERTRAEQEVSRIHRDLVTASHQAGMAEVATGVLHNVGNALNSVNVSTDILAQTLKGSKVRNLERVAQLLREHSDDLATFLGADPKGRQLPAYISQVCDLARTEQELLMGEVRDLRKNVEHMREIVVMQQAYARIGGVAEPAQPAELMDDALRINLSSLGRHAVQVTREYDPDTPAISVQKHKVLQILVNFIQNAQHACNASGRADKLLRLRVRRVAAGVCFDIVDNGIGIAEDLRGKLFTYGFTTRKDGHGFGLHTGVLAAQELGGAITVESDGPGCGAMFRLTLPLAAPQLPASDDPPPAAPNTDSTAS